MNDCLASTGTSVPLPLIITALVLALIGLALLVRSNRGRAAVLAIALVAGVAGLVGVPISSASAADCAPTSTSAPTPTPTATATPTVIAGTWQGEVAESAGLPYTLLARITDDGVTASATNTYFFDIDDSCTSVWTQTSRSAGQVVFLETVDSASICTNGGTIAITFDPLDLSELNFEYTYPGDDELVDSTTLFPATED